MPTAEVRKAERVSGVPCPNCGREGAQALELFTEQGKSAWQGCVVCWPWVVKRGQADVVARLCRLADGIREGNR